MHQAIESYRKTIAASSVAGLTIIAAAYIGHRLAAGIIPAPLVFLLALLGWSAGAMLLVVALGGVLVTFRHSSRERAEPDVFIALNASRSEATLVGRRRHAGADRFAGLPRWLRVQQPRVG